MLCREDKSQSKGIYLLDGEGNVLGSAETCEYSETDGIYIASTQKILHNCTLKNSTALDNYAIKEVVLYDEFQSITLPYFMTKSTAKMYLEDGVPDGNYVFGVCGNPIENTHQSQIPQVEEAERDDDTCFQEELAYTAMCNENYAKEISSSRKQPDGIYVEATEKQRERRTVVKLDGVQILSYEGPLAVTLEIYE